MMTLGQNVWLQRHSEDIPWGFRIGGGRDYKEPIKIQRVTAGSIASRELSTGDLVLRIGHEDTGHLTQAQANDLIKHYGNELQLCVSKSGDTPGAYTPHTPHTPVTPSTPGQVAPSNQHHGLPPSSGRMHDLFEDMYRQSDYQQQSSLNRGFSKDASSRGEKQRFQPKSSPQPYSYNVNESNGGMTKINNETIGPFFPTESDYQNQNGHFKGYKPDTSLNSSTDSGISYGQASHKMGSPTYPNTPASMSSSISELSDTSYGQSQDSQYTSGNYETQNTTEINYEDFPSPPPPLPSTNAQFAPGSPNIKSPLTSLPPPPPLPSSEPPKPWQPTTPVSEEVGQEPRTRLEQQLAELNVTGYMSPSRSYPNTPQTYHSPTAAPGAPGYHPLAGVVPPPPPPPSSQPYSGGSSPYSTTTSPYNASSPPHSKPPPPVADKPQMPDKVLTMAAKSGSDKKPFSYAPDVGSLAEQRDKVRRRGSHKQEADITQSETYKMIHGLDQPKKRPTVTIPNGQDDVIGGYDEASIRYMGRNIPSKSFRMLQNLTGGPDLAVPTTTPKRRPVRKPEAEASLPTQGKDDIASMSYVGGNIPSKSFKMLQQSIGEPETAPSPPPGDIPSSAQGRQVKIIKLRTSQPAAPRINEGATDF